jgi:hypothetical protein
MVTDMCDPATIKAMHMEHAFSIEEALKFKGSNARIAVIPNGVSVIVDAENRIL